MIIERFFYDELPNEEEKLQLKGRLSKTEFNYQQAAYEIFVTEADFVADMQVIIDVFLEPIERQFSKDLVKSIFTDNFVHLHKFHEVLLQSIKALRDGPFTKHGLGELFLKHVWLLCFFSYFCLFLCGLTRSHDVLPRWDAQAIVLQSYSAYFINYPAALMTIEKKKEKESFANFVKACEQNPLCRKLKLQSLLIKPIQRVMKYPLLIRVRASCDKKVLIEIGRSSDACFLSGRRNSSKTAMMRWKKGSWRKLRPAFKKSYQH